MTQARFLGASVTGINFSLGWGNQESRLQVTLVEDRRGGDFFNPPPEGAPVYFDFFGWTFSGLLETIERSVSSSGNPVFSVSIVDPRSILDGVQIVLSDYSGTTNGVPNLINVYGYLERDDFGASGKNDSGIQWHKIRDTISSITALSQASDYGGPISYKGYVYNVSLVGLPILPEFYRISASPSMSLLEFINDVCESSACEYFITLLSNTITINTVSRATVPLKGIINQFVTSVDGAVAKTSGTQMVNEVCSKFLVGGAETSVFYNTYGPGTDNSFEDSVDNPIWYYWGKDLEGNLVVSDTSNQTFNLDSRGVLIPGVGDTYPTDIGEMRAALANQDSWETYLWLNCFNRFLFNADGDRTDRLFKVDSANTGLEITSTTYIHDNEKNPHFGKSVKIGLASSISKTIVSFLFDTSPVDIFNANSNQFIKLKNEEYVKTQIDDMTKLYNLVRAYADEHYGRKYMVMVPDVEVVENEETLELNFSHSVAEAGYVPSENFDAAIDANLMPPSIVDITLPDGRVTSYVRFDNIDELDLSELDPKDLMFGKDVIKTSGGKKYAGINSIFVRCEVEEDYVFLNRFEFTSPRAVINLTSRVYNKLGSVGDTIITEFLNEVAEQKSWSNTNLELVKNKLGSVANSDFFNALTYPTPVIPAMAAIPLVSNIETYGPWYAIGANGKLEFERAEDLVPWNYGGFEALDEAANARVSLAIGNVQWLEAGSIEFPGYPSISPGSQLLSTGPYVTDISVNIGVDKITTTYKMSSWNPRFGKVPKYVLDKINANTKLNQRIMRNNRELIKINSFKNKYLQVKKQLPSLGQ